MPRVPPSWPSASHLAHPYLLQLVQHSQAARVLAQLPPDAFELRLQYLRKPLRQNGQGGQQGGGLKGNESVAIHLLQDDAEH